MKRRHPCSSFQTIATLLAVLVFGTLAGCGARSSLPSEFLGRWEHVGTSGGLDGSGMGAEPTGSITIRSDNTLESHGADGTRVDRVRFTVRRDTTIFSAEPQWIIDAEGDGDVPRVAIVSEDGTTLTLSQNAYDGIARTYVRSR